LVKLVDMDEKVSFFSQMEDENVGPIIVVNKFNMKPEEVNQFLRTWAAESEIMRRQPGVISAQLHRGITGSCVFINYAIWESTKHLKRAFNNPEFQSKLREFPDYMVASPHLFKRVAVHGICLE
jgi:quinol monooxygenase YgiN